MKDDISITILKKVRRIDKRRRERGRKGERQRQRIINISFSIVNTLLGSSQNTLLNLYTCTLAR